MGTAKENPRVQAGSTTALCRLRYVYGQTNRKPVVIKKVRLYSQFLGELNLLDGFFSQTLVLFLFNYETN